MTFEEWFLQKLDVLTEWITHPDPHRAAKDGWNAATERAARIAEMAGGELIAEDSAEEIAAKIRGGE